ncbi:hypothetical protein PCANC_17252 [Puccinia coronata f. sp. avenae]|nr:hypothetical protein PCANC_17252 [Puccinia coronata f. sp. avenae]
MSHSSPASSLASASSLHLSPQSPLDAPLTALAETTDLPSTSHAQPSWTHMHDDEEDEEEEEEEEDRLWDMTPASPASLHQAQQRTHRIPSITLIDPHPELKLATAPAQTTTSSSASLPSSSSLTSAALISPSPIQPPAHPPLSIAHHLPSPNEEWRSKILNSVRIGEERVAQRRKQSLASLNPAITQPPAHASPSEEHPRNEHATSHLKGKQPAVSPTNNIHPATAPPQPHSSTDHPSHPDHATTNLSTNNPYLDLLHHHSSTSNPSHQIFQTTLAANDDQDSTPSHSKPIIPTSQPRIIDQTSSSSPQSPSGPPRSQSHVRSSSNSLTELPSRPIVPNPALNRSNSAVGRDQRLHADEHALPSRNSTSDSPSENPDPPPPVDGTFLTVVEPDLSLRIAAGISSSESTSPDPSQPGSNLSNSPNPHPDPPGQSSTINMRNTNTTRSKTGKRNFFSTLLHRAAGSNSNPTSPGPSSAPGSTVRNPFESTFIRPSDSTHRGPLNRLGTDSHNSSSQGLDASNSDKVTSAVIQSSYATASTLASMNLSLTPLTPTLPASRNSQPLCGAILDDKFLLIGTNTGLDFVPLTPFVKASNASDRSRGSVHTVKPISLIKKTRFKSLKVLEVRSNILLAIAGRNDHLRVYALDGIRAIVAKKIQDLEEKEDFVWLPKPLARVTPHKGKERVSNAQAQPTASSSPQYSPPPPYGGGGKPAPGQSMTKSTSFQPTTAGTQPNEVPRSTLQSNLRRSSTVGSRLPSGSPAFQLSDTRRSSLHSNSDSSSFISPLGLAGSSLASALQSLRNAVSSEPAPSALGQAPVQVGLEHEVEERENRSSQPDSRPIIPNNGELAHGPNAAVVTNNLQGGQTGTALVEVIKNRSQLLAQAGKRISSPALPIQPIPSSRMIPRSALATDTDDNESLDGNQVNLVDVLSQSSSALGMNALTLGSESRTSVGDAPSSASKKKPTAEASSAPCPPPLITTSARDVHPRINITDEITEVDPHPIARSTSPGRSGLPLATTTNSRVPSSSVVHSDQENQPSSLTVPSRSKKRWSVMDSVFRTHSSSSSSNNNNNNSHANHTPSSSAATSASLPPRSSTDESLVRSASCNQISGIPSLDAAIAQQNPTVRPRPSMQKLRTNAAESNGEFGEMGGSSVAAGGGNGPGGSSGMGGGGGGGGSGSGGGGVMGGGPGSRGEFEDQPRERLATHLHGQNAAETAKTSPHPATLGAPLEYVKLARTKGAKLLRAYETRRRTYLAVLCGEASERIELFTGSKNISLSLNRTFVLPETPRTIEFQMQGDDLVDIYLVYDESVFALEPATVRVREVGIGRNERRAARRERERAARDLASINMRPSVTSTGGSYSSAGVNSGQGYSMGDLTTESLIEAVGLPARTTVSSSPSMVDDGLTLSAPVPSSSIRHASAANASSIATGWGSHETPVVNSGSHPGAGKVPNLWPYTTFQQLQFIPPLPPSVLASTFVIPPTYEAVVMASGGPKAVSNSLAPPDEDAARTLSPINVVEPESENLTIPLNLAVDRLRIHNGGSSIAGEAGSEAGSSMGVGNSTTGSVAPSHLNLGDGSDEMDFPSSDVGEATVTAATERPSPSDNPAPQTILSEGPLLSPISLLSNPASRQIGPPGLFLVTRGKKVTSIVDCDGRSVMKKPFIWMNDKRSRPNTSGAENGHLMGGFRIEVVLIDERRTVMVGLDQLEVKLFEVGGRQAKGLEEFSNSATLDIVPQFILGASSGPASQATAFGGGNGVGVITAQSLQSNLNFRDHYHHHQQQQHHHNHHSALNLSSLSNLTMGLSKWNDGSSSSSSNNPHYYHHHHAGGSGSNVSLPGSAPAGAHQFSTAPVHHSPSSITLPPSDREVIFLGSSMTRNAVIWAERIGNSFAIYSLSSISSPPPVHHLPLAHSSSSASAPAAAAGAAAAAASAPSSIPVPHPPSC